MTDFVTRIELHGGSAEDYAILDQAMAAANFSKVIRSGRGLLYHMPSATYFSQADGMSATEVRNIAVQAASRTGRRYDIITASGDTAFALHPVSAA